VRFGFFHNFSRFPVAVVGLVAGSLMLGACTNSPTWAAGRLRVIGAERQYADLLAQLGGRYVSVIAILDSPSIDPHSFEVTTSVARDVSQANLIVQNGLGYDSFMTNVESATTPPRRTVLSVDQVFHVSSKATNPHLWYRVSEMAHLATAVTRRLEKLDPRHRAYFARRLTVWNHSYSLLTAQIRRFRAGHRHASVLVTEPVADYLLTELGVKNLTPPAFERDVMNGIDPAPQDVARSMYLLSHSSVGALMYNEQVSDPSSQQLLRTAKSHHIAQVAVYETMPLHYHYLAWMSAEIRALTFALDAHQTTESL
jgi:zinc/manganese transport system substrate-binding protein